MTDDRPDRQLRAIERVSARAGALTRIVAFLVVAPSLVLMFLAYIVLREIQFHLIGINIPIVTGTLAMIVTMGPGILIGRVLVKGTVRARRQAWIDQAAIEYDVSVASIAEFVQDWN